MFFSYVVPVILVLMSSPFMKVVKAFLTLAGGVFFEVYLRPEFQKALGTSASLDLLAHSSYLFFL
jgi:hypothetical protein